ncbi:ubiquitin-associated domain-containing 1-like [Paramuricea clavata]|uniref:Ubiquitin-associated domain-containing 1-like n=1 Tax=Paramuricea clavata TaxID=317549 RepID=A0A7D9EQJ8_PARCT|nr:ubiquitin-associated domain-containing 1-like [Paramuricea clavata]
MRDVELKRAFRGDTCSNLNIKVTNATGKEFELCLCPSQSVQCLKEEISGENPKDGVYYKLLSMNSNRILDEKKTLAEEGIKENDELLLVKRRKARKPSKEEVTARGPDASQIDKLTAEAGQVQGNKVPDFGASALHFDFNRELQRILITLIDAAHLVQFDNEEEDGDEQTTSEKMEFVNQDHLKQLTDMGFTETRATKALQLNRTSGVEGAMEWLLHHESDPDIDKPLEPQVVNKTESSKTKSHKPHRRREFVPNRKGVENLKDMGFPEEDIIKALKATGNNQRAAVCFNLTHSPAMLPTLL